MTGTFAVLYGLMAGVAALSMVMTVARDGVRIPLVRSFLYFSFGTMIWNAAYSVITLSADVQVVRAVYRFSSIAWGLNPSLAAYYAYRLYCEYTSHRYSRRVSGLIFLPAPFIWLGVFSGNLLAADFERSANGWLEVIDPSSIWNYALLIVVVIGMVAFVRIGIGLSRVFRSKRAKLHGTLITLPAAAMAVLTIVFHIVLPMTGNQQYPPTVQMLLALWVVVVSVVLQRYQVFSLSPTMAADVIVKSMSDICVLTDSKRTVIGANPALRELLGYDGAFFVGKPVRELFPAEVCAAMDDSASAVDGRRTVEASLPASDGTTVPCVVSVNPVRDSLGDQVGFVLIAHEIREEKRLKLLSETDGMTGIYNRRKMEEALAGALSDHRRHLRPCSIIMIDIDLFKSVNDRYGHEAGDKVIVDLCSVVRSAIRGNDLFARWGGEEFMVLCLDTEERDALALAERIRKRIETSDFRHAETVTASFGVAHSRSGDTPESLVRRSDQAMYRSKSEGRNRVTAYAEAEENVERG